MSFECKDCIPPAVFHRASPPGLHPSSVSCLPCMVGKVAHITASSPPNSQMLARLASAVTWWNNWCGNVMRKDELLCFAAAVILCGWSLQAHMSAKTIIAPMILIFHVVLQAAPTSGFWSCTAVWHGCDNRWTKRSGGTGRETIDKSTLSSFALEMSSHNTNPLSKTGKLLQLFDAWQR